MSQARNTVYIERSETEPMMEHCLAAWQGYKYRKYTVKLFTPETIIFIPEGPNQGVIGSTESVEMYLERNWIGPPLPLNIPASLRPFTGREVGVSTLGAYLDAPAVEKLFIKPSLSHKLFTGGVYPRDRTYFELLAKKLPDETPILTSTPVEFLSEYRVLVLRERGMMGMVNYLGDPFLTPDKQRVLAMIEAYRAEAPRCYALDVGVLDNGQTVLVECNDFWGLGTYGFSALDYADMCRLRWYELTGQHD